MDHILFRIRQEKEIAKSLGETRTYVDYCRIEFEYTCIFLLGYLWNKNFSSSRLTSRRRLSVLQSIAKPSIGDMVNICRTLDLEGEFFDGRKKKTPLDRYPSIRNHNFGHSFVFDDKIGEIGEVLEELLSDLFSREGSILLEDFVLVLVTQIDDDVAKGIKFGDSAGPVWQCSARVAQFRSNNVYAKPVNESNTYHRLSPFILIKRPSHFYLFRVMSNVLNGHTTYYQIFNTGTEERYWQEEFSQPAYKNDKLVMSGNGTVQNRYTKNFKRYIDLGSGIKKKIKDFIKNESSVCAVVWGHGGVGKTATVQSLCEDFCQGEKRFDYIIFASAKDRIFDHQTGSIKVTALSERVDSYEGLMRLIYTTRYSTPEELEGEVVSSEETLGTTEDRKQKTPEELEGEVIKSEGRFLIVIDDYETFLSGEREKIESFIERLEAGKHKVLITTRANVPAWKQLPTDELSASQTMQFLIEVMKSEFDTYPIENVVRHANADPTVQDKVYDITSGRPLFIFYFANVLVQEGVEKALTRDIKDKESAREFLFGRIFSYLSRPAQTVFRAISALVTAQDLTHVVAKLQFIVDMEREEDNFTQSLAELQKLKVIEVSDNDLFQVYSPEILKRYKTSGIDGPTHIVRI